MFIIMQRENGIHPENKPLCEIYFSACSTVLQDVFINCALRVIVFPQHLFLNREVGWSQFLALQNSASLSFYKLIFNFNFFCQGDNHKVLCLFSWSIQRLFDDWF